MSTAQHTAGDSAAEDTAPLSPEDNSISLPSPSKPGKLRSPLRRCWEILKRSWSTLRTAPSRLCRTFTAWLSRWPLFFVITAWVALAVALFTFLVWLWAGVIPWYRNSWKQNGDNASVAASLDIVKVALTTIGGIGAVGYLVIKYRERASAEREESRADQREAERRLLDAVTQLGSDSPQVRIAGVYALADVADTYLGNYKQRVVDILCGYLRTERGHWEAVTGDEDKNTIVVNGRKCLQTDGPVESTVLSVLARHLRKANEEEPENECTEHKIHDGQLWCDCHLDLHGAAITEPIPFSGTHIKSASFRQAAFLGVTIFQDSTFQGYVNFSEATFKCETYFQDVTFGSDADFLYTTFNRDTRFGGATFTEKATFKGAHFNRTSDFQRTYFKGASNFCKSIHKGGAAFSQAHFILTDFKCAEFKSKADFSHTRTAQCADYSSATFLREAIFNKASFQHISFDKTSFQQPPEFQHATFNKEYEMSDNPFCWPQTVKLCPDSRLPQGALWVKFDN